MIPVMNFDKARFNMIEQQVRPWDVLDDNVLTCLAQVSREDFVPPAYRKLAFADIAIPLGEGHYMMPPREEGRLLQALTIKQTDSILEIGTGSGHLTALLAKLGAHVTTIDNHAQLSKTASERINALNIKTVDFIVEDALQYCEQQSTCFDVICVSVSVPQEPTLFLERLALGGRLFAIVGQVPIMQATLFTRVGEKKFQQQGLYETVAPALSSFSAPSSFEF